MKVKDALLVKVILSCSVSLVGIVGAWMIFDDSWGSPFIGLVIGFILGFTITMRYSIPAMRIYNSNDAVSIFKKFDIQSSIIYAALWALLTYLWVRDNESWGYLFLGTANGLMAIDAALQLITFDFDRKEVLGLFDNKKQRMDSMQIEYFQDDKGDRVKINDKSGFFIVDRKSFSESNWAILKTNLDKVISIGGD
jgi:hypothetical protein